MHIFSEQPSSVFVEMRLPTKQTFAAGDTVIFTHAVTNTENVYNTNFGFFEPSISGIYSFSVTICTYPGTWIVFGIMKDSEVMTEYLVGDNTWHDCGTSSIVTYIGSGNKIWVKILRTRNGVIDKAYGISSFTGVLLNTVRS